MFGILLSDSTVRRVLHRLDYVFRRPKLWSGPSGENPPEIKKALEEVKKQSKALLSGRNKLPSSACAKENVDEYRAPSHDIDT